MWRVVEGTDGQGESTRDKKITGRGVTWPLAERHAREVKVEHRGPSGKHVLRVQFAPGESSKGSGGQLKAWTGVKLVTGKTDLERGVGDGPSQRRASEQGRMERSFGTH